MELTYIFQPAKACEISEVLSPRIIASTEMEWICMLVIAMEGGRAHNHSLHGEGWLKMSSIISDMFFPPNTKWQRCTVSD